MALLAERGIDLLVAILAVHKAGGAYVPLDPRHPAKRMALVLTQSGTPLVLATAEFLPVLSQAQMLLHQAPPAVPRNRCAPPRAAALRQSPCTLQPHNLAYVIFTSGSTGQPKGVMIEHRGLINHLWALIADMRLGQADRIAQTASQCFDISVWQFIVALVVGGQVHILPDDTAHDPIELLTALDESRLSIVELVPSLIRPMLEHTAQLGARRPRLEALRYLIPTGEALPPDICNQWFAHYPHIPLVNAYGPAECSDDVTWQFLTGLIALKC